MSEHYIEEYVVQESDIDELNHVSNIKYVEWIQEISKAHWYKVTKGTGFDTSYFWVVSSHNIEYKASALLNETVLIETYVEKFEKAFSYRIVEVKDKTSGKLLMKSLTKWCMMDMQTKRIARVPKELFELFRIN
ncbi:acyl-CoA thioesterase [Carboxylicivirga linearis]|uniref:Acyl-CoA thioesterase n=1 Tax=Carboxylicivirga linearis TaxID=1628157 RepID=A0ABS5K1K8_9BACT|nr:acyl-CoA thioesterase [Carboxylicivirga linearis]MBS2100561.1 acyl-CoA thioesterase [Carboxylicivirga linearis]